MELLISQPTLLKLDEALHKAGSQEIGGLLFGEHLGGNLFRLIEISVQQGGGTRGAFVRDPAEHAAQTEAFFARTCKHYTRFNYLGEWHSHPSFAVLPSEEDTRSMRSLLADPAVGVNFVVLLIVRNAGRALEMSATVYVSGSKVAAVHIYTEHTQAMQLRKPVRQL